MGLFRRNKTREVPRSGDPEPEDGKHTPTGESDEAEEERPEKGEESEELLDRLRALGYLE